MLAAYRHAAPRLTEAIRGCANGRKLMRLGFSEDIDFCTTVDAYPIVPFYKDQLLVSMTPSSAG